MLSQPWPLKQGPHNLSTKTDNHIRRMYTQREASNGFPRLKLQRAKNNNLTQQSGLRNRVMSVMMIVQTNQTTTDEHYHTMNMLPKRETEIADQKKKKRKQGLTEGKYSLS